RGAEHWAIVPPSLPMQLQRHGPLPLTTEAVPALQRLVVGAPLAATSFDEPHKLLTGGGEGDDVAEPARDGREELAGGIMVENRLNSLARETETSTSIVDLPGTLLAAPDIMSEKKSRP